MERMLGSALALWTWPLQAARYAGDLAETWLGAQQVVAARLPVIAAAAVDPAGPDRVELARMVTEKVEAFGRSGRSLDVAGARLRATAGANARALGKLAGGGMLWPADWLRLMDDNLATAATLATLPSRSLGPVHAAVAANGRRLPVRR